MWYIHVVIVMVCYVPDHLFYYLLNFYYYFPPVYLLSLVSCLLSKSVLHTHTTYIHVNMYVNDT